MKAAQPPATAIAPADKPKATRGAAKKEDSPPPSASASYLNNLIPDKSVAERYVSRYVEGVLDLDVLAKAQKRRKNILISGDTGSGKTMLIRAYCATTGQPFVNLAGDGSMTPEDFLGGPTLDVATGGLRWLDGPAMMVTQCGGVLNMDEVNFFKGKTTAALHGLTDERGVLTLNKHPFHWMSSTTGMYYITQEDAADASDTANVRVTGAAYLKRHPNLLVVATYNPDYADTSPLNEAFANRFAIKLSWDYDADVEGVLIESKKLLEMAKKLRDAKKTSGTIMTPVSTNMLMAFEELACDDDLTFSFAATNFLNNFPGDEQTAVGEVFKVYRDTLMAEYGWQNA